MTDKILLTLVFALASAILYRMGGAGKSGAWYDKILDTKLRDFGTPAFVFATLFIWGGFNIGYWWAYLLSFGLLFGAMTTYWKKKGTDAKWYNWFFTGSGYATALLPYAFVAKDLIGFSILIFVLPVLITVWSVLIRNAVTEELGRGFITVVVVPLLFLFKNKKN